MACPHPEAQVSTEIVRFTDDTPGPWGVLMISVRCKVCHEAFRFAGAPIGTTLDQPRTGSDGRRMRLPLAATGVLS